MRYLGRVAKYSMLYHIQDICINEMICRVLKSMLNSQISNSILEYSKHRSSIDQSQHMRHPAIVKQSKGILKSSNSIAQMKVARFNDKTVEFSEKFDVNTSHDNPNLAGLEAEADYGANRLENDKCIEWYQDFFNLVFGNGEESKDFFKENVFPIIERYYSYPFEKLTKYTINYNALYYSLIYHCGVKVVKEEEVIPRFGKTEYPFEENNIIRCYTRCNVYKMRNLPVINFANKYKEFRSQDQIESAIQACKSKINYTQMLDNEFDLEAQGEIAELFIEQGLYDEAIEEAKLGLKNCDHENCTAIKFYCVIMRAYHCKMQTKDAQTYFDSAISCLVNHWGQFHPIHSIIYCIMADLMIESKNLKEAEYCYKSSLLCCSKVLGPNHIQTAEVYMNFGRLYLKLNLKPEALVNFQAAYFIYFSYLGKQSLPCANSAFHISSIMEEQGRLEEGLKYALIASDSYLKIKGQVSFSTITSQWLVVSISYSLRDSKVNEYCNQLYEMLTKMDKSYNSKQKEAFEYNSEDDIEQIDKIKAYLVATVIMETSRNLNDEKRYELKRYCESIYEEKQQITDYEITQLYKGLGDDQSVRQNQKQRIDPFLITRLSSIKLNSEGMSLLLYIYDLVKESKFKNIHDFYMDKISNITHLKLLSEENGSFGGKQKASKNEDDLFKMSMDPKDFLEAVTSLFKLFNESHS